MLPLASVPLVALRTRSELEACSVVKVLPDGACNKEVLQPREHHWVPTRGSALATHTGSILYKHAKTRQLTWCCASVLVPLLGALALEVTEEAKVFANLRLPR